MINTETVVRVLIADDQKNIRTGIRNALSAIRGIEIGAEAADGEEALLLSESLPLDVALIDLNMPKRNGFEVIEIISAKIPCVALNSSQSAEDLLRAMQCGATSVLTKDASGATIADALIKAYQDKPLYEKTPVREKINSVADHKRHFYNPFIKLTSREKDVVVLVSQGLTNDEIAVNLGLSRKTVKFHIGNLLSKTETSDRTKLAVLYLKHI